MPKPSDMFDLFRENGNFRKIIENFLENHFCGCSTDCISNCFNFILSLLHFEFIDRFIWIANALRVNMEQIFSLCMEFSGTITPRDRCIKFTAEEIHFVTIRPIH